MSLGKVDMGLLSAEQRIVVGRIQLSLSHPAQDFPMYTPCMIPGTVHMMDFASMTILYYIAQLLLRESDYPYSPDLIT